MRDPSSASSPSSPLEPRPSTADLRRRLLNVEKRIRRDPPAPRPADPPPATGQILAACAALFQPGQYVGVAEIAVAAGVPGETARAVRTWAKAAGCWPYLDALGGWQRSPGRRRKPGTKGGET